MKGFYYFKIREYGFMLSVNEGGSTKWPNFHISLVRGQFYIYLYLPKEHRFYFKRRFWGIA